LRFGVRIREVVVTRAMSAMNVSTTIVGKTIVADFL